ECSVTLKTPSPFRGLNRRRILRLRSSSRLRSGAHRNNGNMISLVLALTPRNTDPSRDGYSSSCNSYGGASNPFTPCSTTTPVLLPEMSPVRTTDSPVAEGQVITDRLQNSGSGIVGMSGVGVIGSTTPTGIGIKNPLTRTWF